MTIPAIAGVGIESLLGSGGQASALGNPAQGSALGNPAQAPAVGAAAQAPALGGAAGSPPAGPAAAIEAPLGGPAGEGPQGGFGGALTEAISSLERTQQQASGAAQSLALGTASDPESAVVTVEDAQLAMQLAAQIRAKATEAVQTVFQTQV